MNRRGFLALAGAALAAPASAHTPYGQWVVYRQKHLLVGAHRGDLRTYDLAKAVVGALAEELPEAQARVARGPRPQRIASLMGTGQLFLAVLSADEAARMARAEAPFEGYRPTPVHAVAALDAEYLLFAAPEFPLDHGRLIAQAVDHAGLGLRPTGQTMHAGAAAYWG
ncbi:hypothetical protein [Roseobacter sinensis]|uniref:Uncharacterized protein n=1 Tax=Roseobacter sinensis TaxID=2931391 RepID=A0ABT3BGT2_9RHOB|nr:hypothetical protein [Roseobacter sp. WL0113]MCV3272750.1 hypothetical protein [Roseobacter sp. WL0113]